MELQIATLCDTASEHQGKLNVIGAFDTILAQKFPAGFSFTLALRFCFTAADHGDHRFSIQLEEEGAEPSAPPQQENTMKVTMPDPSQGFSTRNMIHPLQGQVRKAGIYWFTVRYDGDVLAQVPLRVLSREPQAEESAPEIEETAPEVEDFASHA